MTWYLFERPDPSIYFALSTQMEGSNIPLDEGQEPWRLVREATPEDISSIVDRGEADLKGFCVFKKIID